MPAAEIRQRCPQFDDYTRLTVVRDPYDRAISYFHFSHPTFTPPGGMPLDQAIALLKQGDRHVLRGALCGFPSPWVCPMSRRCSALRGAWRFNAGSASRRCTRIWSSWFAIWAFLLQGAVADALPGFKRNRQGRQDRPAIDDYLSADALELIHQQCGWSFDSFNYQRRSVSSLS